MQFQSRFILWFCYRFPSKSALVLTPNSMHDLPKFVVNKASAITIRRWSGIDRPSAWVRGVVSQSGLRETGIARQLQRAERSRRSQRWSRVKKNRKWRVAWRWVATWPLTSLPPSLRAARFAWDCRAGCRWAGRWWCPTPLRPGP